MAYSLGVDLGTTFVAAAVAVGGRVEMFTLGDRSEVSPSAVCLTDDGSLVTGEAAAGLRTVNTPDRVAREFKRRLGDPTPVVLGGRPFTATQLLGALLRDVLDQVRAAEGAEPEHVVLTQPANWGPFRRALFEEVIQLGGVAAATTMTEPEAAATRYAASRGLGEGRTIAVYDLGGGTFDTTVLRTTAGGGTEVLGAPEGVERLGGIDFDQAVLRHINFTSDNALEGLDMQDPRTLTALARLRQDCTLAKETLSADTETVLSVFLPDRHFDVLLTRGQFEDLIRAQVESTVGALARALDSARVPPADLDAVLLIGGSSRIPLVARMVSAELGRPVAIDTHPKHTVALGAATLAGRAPAPTVSASGQPMSNGSGPPVMAARRPDAAGPATAGSAAGSATAGPASVPALAPESVPPPAYQSGGRQPDRPAAYPPGGRPTDQPAVSYRPPPPPPPYQAPDAHPLPPLPPQPAYDKQPEWSPRAGWEQEARTQAPTGWRQDPTPAYRRPPTRPAMAPTPPPPGGWPPAGAPDEDRRGPRRVLLAVGVLALVVAAGIGGWMLLRPTPPGPQLSSGGGGVTQPANAATLVLTVDRVKIGDSYYLTASGFSPGEDVKLSWAGPTAGTMDALPADSTGTRNHGPVIERDPPGGYVIIATGLSSGKTAEARLQVVPADGAN